MFGEAMASRPSEANLHTTTDPKKLTKLLREHRQLDVNQRDQNGDAAVHAIVRRAPDKHKFDCLLSLLIHSEVDSFDINLTAGDSNTALHLAVKGNDIASVKALLVFGADVNCLNAFGLTPLDIAFREDNMQMVEYLASFGAFTGEYMLQLQQMWAMEDLHLGKNEEAATSMVEASMMSMKLKTGQMSVRRLRGVTQRALMHTGYTPLAFKVHGGERILCLDGGGIKGLIQIEVLMQIEELTGKRITELFNWIVGTSTGGVIALGMVYAKRTLPELRKLYFELKEDVFSTVNRWGFGCNTKNLEVLLKKYLGETTRLSDVDYPKVMITAVDARTTDLNLVFFNNCFFDEYSDELIWKVARYTSAGPVYFEPLDHYVDGGVRANNPCNYALTKIQDFLDKQAEASGKIPKPKPKYACLVSVGCGTYPPEKIGDFSVQLFGRHHLNIRKLMKESGNIIKLLVASIGICEGEAENCRSRCEKQGLPFYRFSPELSEIIALSESDNEKLFDMVLKTQLYLQSREYDVEELVQLCQHTAKFADDGKPKF